MNFNGGTLKASADSATYLQGLDTANVRNGGAVIDTNGKNITIAQNLGHSGIGGDNATDGGLTKHGTGTLTLAGSNTYNGATSVTSGTLRVNGSTHASSTVTVGVSGTLGGTGTIGGSVNVTGVLAPGASVESLATGSLTMNAGSTFAYEVGADHSADLLVVNGLLSLAGVKLDLDAATLANLDLNTWLT